MHLLRLRITNFRALENIDVEFKSLANVIIGPSAVGKTTILEAIRLAKSVLAPRTANETMQTFVSLGLVSPHMPQNILAAALTSDPGKNTTVKCTFKVVPDELKKLEELLPTLPPKFALHNMGLSHSNLSQAMSYLQSPQGQLAMAQAHQAITAEMSSVKSTSRLELNLTIDFGSGALTGEFPIHQIMFGAIEQTLDPSKTNFSYFPADRAMPTGEQPVQLGMADTSQQLESYNSQPQLKYNRLKNMIFNTIINSAKGREELSEQFNLIFSRVLKGRSLGDIGVNSIGMLSIPIIDVETKRQFDIDGLSSGEKGLILTSLLIARSISDNGLILLDEPELHLNPAVCRDLLEFFVEEFALKKNMQAIICSHSAEILAGALERNDCELFHLRDGSSLAKVRQQDQGEIRDALRRLGSSESEGLLFRGTVSVEGIHDVEILRAGFDAILRRYKVKQLGGRSNVEADIRDLQVAEKRGDEIGSYYFLFDHDRKPTKLVDSTNVRLRQLSRYCLENYLLDAEIITDLTREREFAEQEIQSISSTSQKMKTLALKQLNVIAARSVFKELGLESVCFEMKVLDQAAPAAAAALWLRIEAIKSNFEALRGMGFEREYEKRVNSKIQELSQQWEDDWRNQCDGKLLFEDMRASGMIKGDLLRIKRRIALEMRMRSTEAHTLLAGILNDLLATTR